MVIAVRAHCNPLDNIKYIHVEQMNQIRKALSIPAYCAFVYNLNVPPWISSWRYPYPVYNPLQCPM